MTELEKYLDSRDFYEDSQAYRHSTDGATHTIQCWDRIKANVLKYAAGEKFVSEYNYD